MSDVRGKLTRIAAERGQSVGEIIARALAENGSVQQAAGALGVAPNALHCWIKANGYQVKRVVRAELVKQEVR